MEKRGLRFRYYKSEVGLRLSNSICLNGCKYYSTNLPELRKLGFPGVPLVKKRICKDAVEAPLHSIGSQPSVGEIEAKRA
ncbi:MAG: hypothetical protein FJX92_08875 [Bacteroidetes bacterium]|nr:hypothetical protein [Bacteroidota bacterium]